MRNTNNFRFKPVTISNIQSKIIKSLSQKGNNTW